MHLHFNIILRATSFNTFNLFDVFTGKYQNSRLFLEKSHDCVSLTGIAGLVCIFAVRWHTFTRVYSIVQSTAPPIHISMN